jgi:hypothetical protein
VKSWPKAAQWTAWAIGTVLLVLAWESFVRTTITPALGSDTISGSATGGVAAHRTEYMPCAGNDTERNCVWDNKHSGEGDGFSFSFFVAPSGLVYRLPHHIAHALIYGGEQ